MSEAATIENAIRAAVQARFEEEVDFLAELVRHAVRQSARRLRARMPQRAAALLEALGFDGRAPSGAGSRWCGGRA